MRSVSVLKNVSVGTPLGLVYAQHGLAVPLPLVCADTWPTGMSSHTSSMAAKSFQRLDDALEDCNVVVLIKIDPMYKLVLIYFSVRRAWRCRVGSYGDRSYSVC